MKKDLTGKTFGDLFVIGVSEVSRNGHYRYHVRCSCGVEKTLLGTHMLQGNTLHCGQCKERRKPRNWTGSGSVSGAYFAHIKSGAAGARGRRPLPFELSIEYVADLLDNKQKGLCALSKLPISIKAHTASLDRIDSSLGYLEGNVQWLHKDVNMMKRHYNQDYFLELCKLISGVCEIVDLT